MAFKNFGITYEMKYVGGADKFCLYMHIFMYIRHIWIKPVLFSRMVSLFRHTSPWTHRCLQSSSSAHRNRRVCRCSVQTACCYWILKRGKSSSNWNSQANESRLWWSVCWCEYSKVLGKVKCAVRKWFGDQCVDMSTVRRWVRWSVQWGNGLWWSVCWSEYSKTLGKVKCAVRKWFVVISVLMWVQ